MFCDTWRKKIKTGSNASRRYFPKSVLLTNCIYIFMYYFLPRFSFPFTSHWSQPEPIFPGVFPGWKSESLLIATTITQQIRRDWGPFPHHFPPSLMRKSSPASAGSLLPSLRQDTARQYIFIKAQARSCSRGLGFNVIYGEPLQRRSGNLQFNWGDLEGLASVNKQRDGDAWTEIEIALITLLILRVFSLKLLALVFLYWFSALIFFLYCMWFSSILYQTCIHGEANFFLGVGATPFPTKVPMGIDGKGLGNMVLVPSATEKQLWLCMWY